MLTDAHNDLKVQSTRYNNFLQGQGKPGQDLGNVLYTPYQPARLG